MLLKWENPLLSLLQKISYFPERSTEQAAFALITAELDGEKCYLLQWNPKWQCYNFIGGKVENGKKDNNNFANTIRREVKEEMGIELEGLLVEREIKQIQLWQFSKREKKLKPYRFSVFEICFFPDLPVERQKIKRALCWLSSKHDNIYVSQKEILKLETNTGKPISKTVKLVLADLNML